MRAAAGTRRRALDARLAAGRVDCQAPEERDAHAAAGHRVSGWARRRRRRRPPVLRRLRGQQGGGNSAGRRSAATRWSTPSTHRIARARVSGSPRGGSAPRPGAGRRRGTPATAPAARPRARPRASPPRASAARALERRWRRRQPLSGNLRQVPAPTRGMRTPISTSASARRGDTPGEDATAARALERQARARAPPPRALAVSGATRPSSPRNGSFGPSLGRAPRRTRGAAAGAAAEAAASCTRTP